MSRCQASVLNLVMSIVNEDGEEEDTFLSAEGILLNENFNTIKDIKYLGQSLKSFLNQKTLSHYLGEKCDQSMPFLFH